MRIAALGVGLVVACYSGETCAAELTASPRLGAGAERGIATVRCATAVDGVTSYSRGAILDVGASASTDVVLTTAHGLPPDEQSAKRDCRLLVRGEPYRIAAVLHAGGDLAGPQHDWAVVVTPRIAGNVHRWRAGRVTADWLVDATARAAPVTLVLRSAEAQVDCRLEAATPDARVLLAHSCPSHPGTSGSPLVVGLVDEPEPVLIGLHIGTQMRWVGFKLDFASVARPLDAEVAAAIELAAQQTVAAPVRMRRRSR